MTRIQQRLCVNCGDKFQYETKAGRPPATCSPACRLRVKSQQTRFCSRVGCGKEYDKDNALAQPPYFCSEDCRLKSYSTGRACKWCGEDLGPLDIQGNNYCSFEHFQQAAEGAECARCHGPVIIPQTEAPWGRVPRYCGEECRMAGATPGRPLHRTSSRQSHDYAELLRVDPKTSKIHTLPVSRGGRPYSSVCAPEDLPDIKPSRDFSKALAQGIEFRRWQLTQVMASDLAPTLQGPAMQVLGTQTHSHPRFGYPVSPLHPHYLPSLAEVYAWLPWEKQWTLKRIGYLTWCREAVRKRGSVSAARSAEDKINTWRGKLAVGDSDITTRYTGKLGSVTCVMIELFQWSRELLRAVTLPDPETYLPAEAISALQLSQASQENPFGVEGPILALVNEHRQEYLRRINSRKYPAHPKELDLHGRSLWVHMMMERDISAAQFAHWLVQSNTVDGQGKDWTMGLREYDPDDN